MHFPETSSGDTSVSALLLLLLVSGGCSELEQADISFLAVVRFTVAEGAVVQVRPHSKGQQLGRRR